MKPTRADSSDYSVMTSDGYARQMYLQLNSIVNHPTWAVAFEIVRAKRIPRVLFQTPIIPMMYVEGIGALQT